MPVPLSRTLAGLLALGLCYMAATRPALAEDTKTEVKPKTLNEDQRIVHFLNRFTLGATPELCAQVKEKGMKAWLQEQFKGAREEPKALTSALAELGSLEMASDERQHIHWVDEWLKKFPETNNQNDDPDPPIYSE